jgi:hypothetical protein
MHGEIEAGLTLAMEAVAMAREAIQSEQEPECLRVAGILHTMAGEGSEAEKLLQAAADGSRRRNDSYREGLALLDLGRLHEHSKSSDDELRALAEYDAATEHLARLGAAYELQIAIAAREQLRRRLDMRTARNVQAQRRIFAFDQHKDTERPMIPK